MNHLSLNGCLLSESQSESTSVITLLKECGIQTVIPFSINNFEIDYLNAFDILIYEYHIGNEKTFRNLTDKIKANHKDLLILVLDIEKSISVDCFCHKNFKILQSKINRGDLIFYIEELLNIEKNYSIKKYILARSGNYLEKVIVNEIKYIEVDSKYLNIKTSHKTYYIRASLNEFAKKIPDNFVRISQSAIINLNFLERISISQNIVHVSGDKLKISRQYKSALSKKYLIS